MPHDIKSYLQIQEAVTRLDTIAKSIQQLVTDGPAGLTDARDDLENIRRDVEALGARMIDRALGVTGPPVP
jgi:hypothetical protein